MRSWQANPLSLHHLTALDVPPAELVSIAAEVGCPSVCLFTQVEPAMSDLFPCVADAAGVAAVTARCAETGVSVHNLEYFPVTAETDLEAFRPGLERGARLGAARATAHVHDPEPARGLAALAGLADLAAEYGLRIGLEFTAFSQVRDLRSAIAVVAAADRDNLDVVLDALHFFRCGGKVADLAAVDMSRIGYVQINDGLLRIADADRIDEAVFERALPGEGEFPLHAFLALIPPGPVISIETPQRARQLQGMGPLERTRLAMAATLRVLEGSAPLTG